MPKETTAPGRTLLLSQACPRNYLEDGGIDGRGDGGDKSMCRTRRWPTIGNGTTLPLLPPSAAETHLEIHLDWVPYHSIGYSL